ncbi:T9SS type A sorting domain-containing protein [Chryseobacterium polytrichastri]|uniref:Por secretion system C-terminal sorting domain-containing protein n=1 Tax=Chryseobacterium polytrichastri TaxID=1302687 RepID=A0A1M6Y3Z4_9FLAO|nr:T9SS type A sorting domain-containing protein [Chryseobacterium polytrichastri]SHL12934.1 Por secretion system C-terminal sorting domain-containing protein [Chryseobacterium polytrichastri]
MKKVLFTVITMMCANFEVSAQWNPNTAQNLLVTDPGSGGSAFSATTKDGKTYIGFWKKLSTAANFELWLQILDQNGNKQLGANGVMLSNQIPMGSYTIVERTAVDAADNLYIGVTGTGAGTLGYVFKINPQGVSAWPNGINLGEGYLPTILPLSNGDVIVSYWPQSQKYARVQRFNANGVAVWSASVQILSDTTTNNTVPAALFELPNNEVEIIFNKVTTGTYSYPFAQKLSIADGALLWDGAKQISTKTTSWNVLYQGVADGNTVYFGFTSGQGGWHHSYLQRINTDGTLPWGVDGSDFDNTMTYRQKDMKIAYSQGSPYIWSIANYSNSAQGLNGEFVQKFDKNTGARLFTDNAKQVFPMDDNQIFHTGNLHLADDKPYFVVQKRMAPSNVNTSLDAVALDNNGNFLWPQNSVPMATYAGSKTFVTSLKPINGQGVVVFLEQKSADANSVIYAHHLALSTLATNEVSTNHSGIEIYPNPVKDILTVKGLKKSENISIYSISGQLITSEKVNLEKINVQNLESGVYTLKVEGQSKGFKFIKK